MMLCNFRFPAHPVAVALAALALAACDAREPGSRPATGGAAHTITIMAFNVENLFDNRDDPDKVDETFLAIGDKQTPEHIANCEAISVERWRNQCLYWDWSDDIIDTKLAVIADAILQIGSGRGADIIALQEVENIGIVERLRTEYLADAGYLPTVLIEGHDARGIDVAFLTRLPLHDEPRLLPTPFEGIEPERVADTRGILEVTFVRPDGGLLTGYSVHFPAPFHPTVMREFAYRHLNALQAALPADQPAFAAGDFNTTAAEDREKSMLDRFARPTWTIAHDLGCGDCRGTSYYARADEWSFLDMILWSGARGGGNRGENTTWRIRANSVLIANQTAAQTLPDGTPARFEMPAGSGVSDHWPVVITIETK
jgi:endonuclease/exonuclease/phosphatase family metal-dependent hydrolase